MSDRKRRVFATLAGILLLALLLVLVSLDGLYTPEPPEQVALREIQMYVPPPPPPAPPLESSDSARDAGRPLTLASLSTPVVLEIMDLDVELPAGDLGDFGFGAAGLGEGIGTDWGAVSISELDSLPYVISAPIFVWPAELIERGVDEFRVTINIQIDKDGRVYPGSIASSDFPSLNDAILEYASKVRFSPPEVLGIPVRAAYLWPLLFQRPRDGE